MQWILAKLEVPLEENGEALKDQEDASDVVVRAGDDELQPLLVGVIELLPEASDEHWWMLCEAARLLADRSVKDPRVLQIVSRRYLDPQLNANTATFVLQQYDPEGTADLIAQRLRLEMGVAREPKALKEPILEGFFPWAELDQLLPPTYAVRQELILQAMNHPHADVRATGYRSWRGLPKPVARTILVKGLADLSPHIRCECIQTLADYFATVEDLRRCASIVREKPTEGFWRFWTAFLEETSGRTWKTIRQEDILQLRVAGRDEGFTF